MDQLPTYTKGQHLRGVDVTIVERVSTEMVRSATKPLASYLAARRTVNTSCCLAASAGAVHIGLPALVHHARRARCLHVLAPIPVGLF